jgi:hypothetical protein
LLLLQLVDDLLVLILASDVLTPIVTKALIGVLIQTQSHYYIYINGNRSDYAHPRPFENRSLGYLRFGRLSIEFGYRVAQSQPNSNAEVNP